MTALIIGLFLALAAPGNLFAAGDCPQDRFTPAAPQKFLDMKNPLPPNKRNLKFGEFYYQLQGQPIACKTCHGENGDGRAESGYDFNPPPRNFTCAATMKPLADGQLFWIIRNGSPHTRMYAFPSLTDKQIWQLIHYIRQFSK
ncbi:c-type cytochrome [Candidatus Saccharibacteria bacterium]|nr:c-type cytochrome [Calditrichia bacterium]NIV72238.1 c-type cytochrome [Calditrichia bacterium]NIV99193.1 c-type cytochrome [Candidatus Saccharibacteria bacterium]NIW79485.1 c-type cytochrome [Calditrichia bacterium]